MQLPCLYLMFVQDCKGTERRNIETEAAVDSVGVLLLDYRGIVNNWSDFLEWEW